MISTDPDGTIWRVSDIENIVSYAWTSNLYVAALTLVEQAPLHLTFGPNGQAVTRLAERVATLTTDEVRRAGVLTPGDEFRSLPRRSFRDLNAARYARTAVLERARQIDPEAIGDVWYDLAFPPYVGFIDEDWERVQQAAVLASTSLAFSEDLEPSQLKARLAPWRAIVEALEPRPTDPTDEVS